MKEIVSTGASSFQNSLARSKVELYRAKQHEIAIDSHRRGPKDHGADNGYKPQCR